MEPSQELRDLIVGWFQAVERGDASWADRYISRQPGARVVGTDPSEWMDGEHGQAFLSEEAKAMGGQIKVKVDEVEAFREGTVGWGIARPTNHVAERKRILTSLGRSVPPGKRPVENRAAPRVGGDIERTNPGIRMR